MAREGARAAAHANLAERPLGPTLDIHSPSTTIQVRHMMMLSWCRGGENSMFYHQDSCPDCWARRGSHRGVELEGAQGGEMLQTSTGCSRSFVESESAEKASAAPATVGAAVGAELEDAIVLAPRRLAPRGESVPIARIPQL